MRCCTQNKAKSEYRIKKQNIVKMANVVFIFSSWQSQLAQRSAYFHDKMISVSAFIILHLFAFHYKQLLQVKDGLMKLDAEQQALNALWKEKEKRLKELLNLQLLNTEAERIDAATKGHEAFLELPTLGVSHRVFLLKL